MDSTQDIRDWIERDLERERTNGLAERKGSTTQAVARDGLDNVVGMYALLEALSVVMTLDLRRRPWAGNHTLKRILISMRGPAKRLQLRVYRRLWGEL